MSGHIGSGSGLISKKYKWKRVDSNVVEAEAEAEAASFKKLEAEAEAEALHAEAEAEAEAEAIKKSPLPHHWWQLARVSHFMAAESEGYKGGEGS